MRSRINSYAATVATVNRLSTEALISLGASVDGEVRDTSLSTGTARPVVARDPLHFDAAWRATSDVARTVACGIKPPKVGASPPRTEDAVSWRGLGDSRVAAPGCCTLPTIDGSLRSVLRGRK